MIDKTLIEKHFEGIENADKIMKNVLETVNNTFSLELSKANSVVKGETLQLVDDALKDAGHEKPSGEKTTDFLKGVIQKTVYSTNEKQKKYEELKAELEEYKKSGGKDSFLKEKYDQKEIELKAVRDSMKELEGVKAKEIEKLMLDNKNNIKKNAILNALPKFKDGVSEKQINLYRNEAIKELMSNMDIVEDSPVFKDESGQIILNPDNNQKPFTINEMILKNSYISEIADLTNKVNGNGTPRIVEGGNDYRFAGAKDKDDLVIKMKEAKIELSTDEGLKLYAKESERFDKQ